MDLGIPLPIPPVVDLRVPTHDLKLPNFQPPTWVRIPVYREDVPDVAPTKTEEKEEEPEEEKELNTPPPVKAPPIDLPEGIFNTIEVPLVGIEIPIPPQEILVTAGTTASIAAVASVGGTLAATAMFKQVVKILNPVIKAVLKKLAKAKGKTLPTWSRQRLENKRKAIAKE